MTDNLLILSLTTPLNVYLSLYSLFAGNRCEKFPNIAKPAGWQHAENKPGALRLQNHWERQRNHSANNYQRALTTYVDWVKLAL
jgi:hypothetical protein